MDQVRQRRLTGFTLIEVLVASAVFVGLAVILLSIYTVSLRAKTKEDVHSATYRACMLGLEHIQERLRGCRLVTPTDPAPSATVRFQFPAVSDGVMEVDGDGMPAWAGTAELGTDTGGNLILTYPDGSVRLLAALGPGGSASFTRLEPRLLQVELVAVRGHAYDQVRRSRYALKSRISLPNQP